MLKVSLLPVSYRKHIEGKKKKDLISKVALIMLVCTFIVYGGVAIKGQILLESKLNKIEAENAKLEQQFPALQKYQEIYNSLKKSQEMIKSISPQPPEAVEFLNMVFNVTPDYVQVVDVKLENWFTAGVCAINCIAQDYSDAQDYIALFKTEEMTKTIKLVELTSIKRETSSDGSKSVLFTVTLSMSNAVTPSTQPPKIVTVTNKKGDTVTKEDGKPETSVENTTSNASGSTAQGSSGGTTADGGATTAATTAKGDKK